MACFHRWDPVSMEWLKMRVSRWGLVACAHFSIRYPILLGPGMEKSDAVLRAVEISSGVMGSHAWVGSDGGSSSWIRLTHCGFSRKYQFWKIWALCMGLSTRVLLLSQSGGTVLAWRPLQTLVRVHMSCASTA